jgi:hypothetical protein
MALILDGTTGIGIDSGTQPLDPTSLNAVVQAIIPTGTRMLFQQTAAPTGWTKDTTHDNKALRVVSGTAGSGGSVAFTTAFASQAVSGSIGNTTATNQATTAGGTVGNTTLSEAQIPSHTHTMVPMGCSPSASGNIDSNGFVTGGAAADRQGGTRGNNFTGSSNSHNHSFSGSSHNHTQDAHNHSFTGTAINLAVSYVDLIIATKD